MYMYMCACDEYIAVTKQTFSFQWQIIPLLTKAISHFKNHRSERMIALLKVLLAEEYYHIRQYDNALT